MTLEKSSEPDLLTALSDPEKLPKKLGLLTMFQLSLFQMGLGMMSILTLGVLSRVLINGIKVSATAAAIAIAMHQFVSPVRVWFGQLSDAKKIFGYHRTGFIWIGAGIFAVASFLAVQATWQLGSSLQASNSGAWTTEVWGWIVLLGAIFALYGLAVSFSATPYAALLVDVSDEEDRSKLVGVVWSMLTVGIVIGAIASSGILKGISNGSSIDSLRDSVNRLFVIVPALVFGLAILSTSGIEKKYSRFSSRSTLSNREDKITLGVAWRVLTASRQTGLFFTFLLVMTISLFMQDPVLEAYGAEVFDMDYAGTAQLSAYWGTGTLIGLSGTGFAIVPRLGKQQTTRIGCLATAGCFGLVILAGFTADVRILRGALFLFGITAGMATAGAINLMLDLTASETAGTFLGAWGLAQSIARGLSTVAGGATLDVGRKLFAAPVLSYGLVFALEALGMILAVWLLSRVDIREFRASTRAAIATALVSELD